MGEDRFFPFGETRFTTGTMLTDKLFTGQRQITISGSEIYNYGTRFYSPKLGRFLSSDTTIAALPNPQKLNHFSYAVNNPLRYTDPTGHRACDNVDAAGRCITEPGGGLGGFGGGPIILHPPGSGTGGGSGGNGGGYHPPVVIPGSLCHMLNCSQQSPYDYAMSHLPFTGSDACYTLIHDSILCNSSSWQGFPNITITSGPTNGMTLSFVQNYCGYISGLACAANLTQDLATLTDLVGTGLIEGPAVGAGFIEGGPLGAAIAEVGVAATWTVTLNNAETGFSSASLGFTILDDFVNNGGWGENSSTSLATWGAGLVPLSPSWDLAVDTDASGYNHGFFNGVNTILDNGLFK